MQLFRPEWVATTSPRRRIHVISDSVSVIWSVSSDFHPRGDVASYNFGSGTVLIKGLFRGKKRKERHHPKEGKKSVSEKSSILRNPTIFLFALSIYQMVPQTIFISGSSTMTLFSDGRFSSRRFSAIVLELSKFGDPRLRVRIRNEYEPALIAQLEQWTPQSP